jgi:transposase-like protein
MTTGIPIPDDIRAAAVADYLESGEPYAVVAARHGVTKSSLCDWVNPRRRRERSMRWAEEEIALTGGDWVVRRGVRRWQSWGEVA